MRWRERVAAGLVVAPFLVGAFVGASEAGPAGGTQVCAFQDPAITEASGLVRTGGLFVTMNDSGDSARVFAVDPRTCATVGVTRWNADAVDDESLAPAGPGYVWVGDTGDNLSTRSSITVARVPIGRGDRTVPGEVHELVYPDGAHDAETLLRNPVTGQLFVVSKEFIGRIYAAPLHLHAGANRLTAGRTVLGIATDGAFFPDGRHLVLRNYGQAVIYTWPQLVEVARIDLPRQRQGEGIAVAPDGRIFLSSEGEHAPVLELHLSSAVREALRGSRDGCCATSSTTADRGSFLPWLAGGAGVVVLVGAAVAVVRRRSAA
ncbi:MAG TPA: hypothetical protein VJ872_03335 [Nocardioides sp.]|nr:hypothetical protein [Nocardioides sp.]